MPDGWVTVVISLVGAITGAFGVELVRQWAARGEKRMSFDERQREELAERVRVLEAQVNDDRREYDRRMDQLRSEFGTRERDLNKQLDAEAAKAIRAEAQLSIALREVRWWRGHYPDAAVPFVQADASQLREFGKLGLLPSDLPPEPEPRILNTKKHE